MAAIYKPEEIIIPSSSSSIAKKYAIIISDGIITIPPQIMIPIWNKAIIRIAAGPGAKIWINYIKQHQIKNISPIDIIIGDIKGIAIDGIIAGDISAKIIANIDGGESILMKSLIEINNHIRINKIQLDYIISIQQKSGKIHNILEDINIINSEIISNIFIDIPIILLSDEIISWIIKIGRSIIQIPDILQNKEGISCGIFPIGGKIPSIITSGLKKNINGEIIKEGEIIGACGIIEGAKIISIETKAPILWIMDISQIIDNIIINNNIIGNII